MDPATSPLPPAQPSAPPPLPSSADPPPDQSAGTGWAWIGGWGHVLYVASAACILIGIAQIVVPAYQTRAAAPAAIQGWGALNAYELALLATLLLVVLWRGVWDDAISLTLLVVAFVVGTSITLDTVGPVKPATTVALGLLGLALGAGKLAALSRWVTAKIGPCASAGIALLLAWNFLMPGVMGYRLADQPMDADVRPIWLLGWWVGLAGAAVVLAGAWRLADPAPAEDATASGHGPQAPVPCVRSGGMAWLCAFLLVIATFAHQYALNYVTITGVPSLGDFLPALGLAVLLLMEITRAHAWRFRHSDLVLAWTPLAAALLALVDGGYHSRWHLSLELVNYPPVFLIEMALVLSLMAWLRRNVGLGLTAGVYLVLGAAVLYKDLAGGRPSLGPWLWVLAAFALLGLGFLTTMYKSRAVLRPRL